MMSYRIWQMITWRSRGVPQLNTCWSMQAKIEPAHFLLFMAKVIDKLNLQEPQSNACWFMEVMPRSFQLVRTFVTVPQSPFFIQICVIHLHSDLY